MTENKRNKLLRECIPSLRDADTSIARHNLASIADSLVCEYVDLDYKKICKEIKYWSKEC